ncbi:MAG: hypothetical protein GY835_00020 [bacterium]|nr:hypothetical protein [bacterium]
MTPDVQLRIIIGAMIAALVLFGLTATFLVTSGTMTPQPDLAVLLLGALAALAVSELAAYIVLRQAFIKNQQQAWRNRSRDEELAPDLLTPFTTLTIIGTAMAEALGLFGVVIFLLTSHLGGLAGAVVSLALLLRQLGVRDRFQDFVRAVTGSR